MKNLWMVLVTGSLMAAMVSAQDPGGPGLDEADLDPEFAAAPTFECADESAEEASCGSEPEEEDGFLAAAKPAPKGHAEAFRGTVHRAGDRLDFWFYPAGIRKKGKLQIITLYAKVSSFGKAPVRRAFVWTQVSTGTGMPTPEFSLDFDKPSSIGGLELVELSKSGSHYRLTYQLAPGINNTVTLRKVTVMTKKAVKVR